MLRVSSDRRKAAVRIRTTVVQIRTTVVQIRTTDARSISASVGVVIILRKLSKLR